MNCGAHTNCPAVDKPGAADKPNDSVLQSGKRFKYPRRPCVRPVHLRGRQACAKSLPDSDRNPSWQQFPPTPPTVRIRLPDRCKAELRGLVAAALPTFSSGNLRGFGLPTSARVKAGCVETLWITSDGGVSVRICRINLGSEQFGTR